MTDHAGPGSGPPPPPGAPALPPAGSPAWPPPAPAPGAGWAAPQAANRPRSRRRWVIGCAVLLILLVLGVGACTLLFVRSLGSAATVIGASNGRIDGVNVQNNNGRTTITFQAARGVDESEGPRLACDVVRPALAGSDQAEARWVIVNRAGDVIASDRTPCP